MEAQSLYDLKKYSEAFDILFEIYPEAVLQYGPTHELTMIIHLTMGRIMGALGNHEDELEIFEEIDKINMYKYGANHLKTHNSRAALIAPVMILLGRHDEALKLCADAYEVQKKELGETHERTQMTKIAIDLALQDKALNQ